MTKGLIDFHCHLDLSPNFEQAVSAAEAAGVFTLTVTTTPRAWPRNRDLTKGTRRVRAALGIHPQLVAERANELALWETYLHEARYIGEVGLDAGPKFYRSLDQQKQIFEHILKCCEEAGGKILTIHSVRAATAVLDRIEAYLPPHRGRAVLHWFTGSRSEAKRAIELGCYFSVNLEMLKTTRGQKLIEFLPLDRILTETDGPFTIVNGHPAVPSDVGRVLDALARSRKVPSADVEEQLHRNLRRLVSD